MSVAALGFTIAFKERVLGETGLMRVNVLLSISWLAFLLAISASEYYQWVAVRIIKFYQERSADIENLYFPFTVEWLWSWYAYGHYFSAAQLSWYLPQPRNY